MTELLKRTYSGFGYIIVIILGTVLHPYIFAIVFATILFLMLNEFYSMIQKGGMQPQKIPGIISGIFLFALTFLSASGLVSGKYFFLIIPILFSIFIIELFRNKEKPLKNIATTILGLIYVALPVSLINYLVSPGLTGKLDYYPWILMGIFFIVWSYDSGAYLFGMWLGKSKLFERISPKKSWEGAIGGAIIASIVGILISVVSQSLDLKNWIAISSIVIIFGTLGDLIESMFKRSMNIKDTGNILPGHGGLLDRFDSLLLAIPFIFTWLIIFKH